MNHPMARVTPVFVPAKSFMSIQGKAPAPHRTLDAFSG